MKKYFSLFLAIFIFSAASAQNSLEFNRVLLIDTAAQTVPVGKVWKVESIMTNAVNSLDGYSILVNGNEIFVGEYKSGDLYWSNIESLEVDVRKTNSNSCTYSNTYNLYVTGFENDLPFSRNLSQSLTKGSASTSFSNLMTFLPQTNGSKLEFTSIRLYCSYRWEPYEVRVTVNYVGGYTQSYVYENTGTICQSYANTHYMIGNSSGYYEIPVRSKEKYSHSSELPMWLPEGTVLKANKHTKYINVIEFNVN